MTTTSTILMLAGAWLLSAGCAHETTVSAATPARPSAPQSVPQIVAPPPPPSAAPATTGAADAEAIYFSLDQALVQTDAEPVLNEIARHMRVNPQARLRIEGNCDERGTTEYNIALGEHRARAAREYLLRLGIPDDRIQIVSYGSERPRQNGHDEKAWAQNRRDDFRVR